MRTHRNKRAGAGLSRRQRIAYLRGRLLERRRKFLEALRAELRVTAETATWLPSDSGDLASSNEAQDTSRKIGAIESASLDQVDSALRKLEDGTYGTCEHCGARIPASRLRALPFASLCLMCKVAEERAERAEEESSEDGEAEGDIFADGFYGSDLPEPVATMRGRRVG